VRVVRGRMAEQTGQEWRSRGHRSARTVTGVNIVVKEPVRDGRDVRLVVTVTDSGGDALALPGDR
jgi:hypothetical protein